MAEVCLVIPVRWAQQGRVGVSRYSHPRPLSRSTQADPPRERGRLTWLLLLGWGGGAPLPGRACRGTGRGVGGEGSGLRAIARRSARRPPSPRRTAGRSCPGAPAMPRTATIPALNPRLDIDGQEDGPPAGVRGEAGRLDEPGGRQGDGVHVRQARDARPRYRGRRCRSGRGRRRRPGARRRRARRTARADLSSAGFPGFGGSSSRVPAEEPGHARTRAPTNRAWPRSAAPERGSCRGATAAISTRTRPKTTVEASMTTSAASRESSGVLAAAPGVAGRGGRAGDERRPGCRRAPSRPGRRTACTPRSRPGTGRRSAPPSTRSDRGSGLRRAQGRGPAGPGG